MEAVNAAALKYSQDLWWQAAKEKPKLSTYLDFSEIDDPRTLVKANLPRGQRSLIPKLMCGILPFEVEVGRFVCKDKEERVCTVCGSQQIEDEYHVLYSCVALKPVRKAFYREYIPNYKGFKKLENRVKTKILMEAEMIKNTGFFIEQMFKKRRDILYNKNME